MRDLQKTLRVALERGVHSHSDTNSKVLYTPQKVRLLTFEGMQAFSTSPGYDHLLTFDGPRLEMTGELRFYHWDVEILTVNFDEGWITDHGYHQYSITTGRRLGEWLGALRRYLPDLPYSWERWTANGRRRHGTSKLPEIDEDLVRFRTRASWMLPRNPYLTSREVTWQFYWRRHDQALEDAFWRSQEFLRAPANRRYFTYDWDDDVKFMRATPKPHHWKRSFVSGDAERRWRARERKNGRPCPPT